MPLHPDIEAFLELANAGRRKAMHDMSAGEARDAYDTSTLMLDEPGANVPATDLRINGISGHAIPARLYRGAPSSTPATAPLPTLLFFHGGGYVLGGLDSHDALCRDVADAAGCAVLAIDYRRAPEHRFPAAFEDAQAARDWLLREGHAQGLDTTRLAYGGDSVGGTLAAALCIDARLKQLPQPAAQVLVYPCTSARQDSTSHRAFGVGHLLEGQTLQWMFAQYLRDERDRLDWRFAPLEMPDLSALAPAFIALAEFDPLLDEGLQYARRLDAAGVHTDVRVYEGMVHDFARLGQVTSQAALIKQDMARALVSAWET